MSHRLTDVARKLRRTSTKHETLMWQLLRNRQVEGVKFRRQMPIGNHVADFASVELKLVIEIDGGHHNAAVDVGRTAVIEHFGYRVLRFWNNEVIENRDGVAAAIVEAVRTARAR